MYIALGAMIFQALEKDFEVERRELAVDTKCDFLKNRSNMTQEDVEVFVQMMTSLILSGIPPLGNKTNALLWTFGSSFTTSLTILSTIGYGTVFPRTPGGQMFCVVFAAIGIPLTIVFFKNIGKLVSLPFEKLGNCLKHKGISEEYKEGVPFREPMGAGGQENWTYIEGVYYSFTTISAIGFGDYTIVSNPMKESQNIAYSILLLIWNLHGLAWIALVFHLITNVFQEMESKLNKNISEIEVEAESMKSGAGDPHGR
uniref:Potassium channel domain-containing protein n=1 Tax=Equus caballus TaxID=9796 RepID=A0A3Q2LNK3_HORSE